MNHIAYAFRTLTKNSRLTVCVISLLALGMGTTTVMFSAFDRLMLRQLPVRDPGHLVRLVQKFPQIGTRSEFPYGVYELLTRESKTLSAVFGESEMAVPLSDPGPTAIVRVGLVTPQFFEELGVQALYGRYLTRDDARENSADMPAVLSYAFWARQFAADRKTIGRTITLGNRRFLVVGVMPAVFNGIAVEASPDVRIPIRAYGLLARAQVSREDPSRPPLMERDASFELAGRLRPGTSLQQAETEALPIWREAESGYWRDLLNRPPDFVEQRLKDSLRLDNLDRGVSILRDRFGVALQLLLACAATLLILVCANVAALLVAWNVNRQQEIAVRLAIGATRAAVVRQLLVENLLLAAGGTTGGLALATIAGPLFVRALPSMRDYSRNLLTIALDLHPDWRIFLFALAMLTGTLLLFGVMPAFTAARQNLDSILRGTKASLRWRGRKILVILQVTLCTALMVGGGVLVRTLVKLRGTDPGFDAAHIATFTLNPGLADLEGERADSLRKAVLERVRSIPGVRQAATAGIEIMRGSGLKTTLAPAGREITAADFLNSSMNEVSPEYFETMGMRVSDGRDLRIDDIVSMVPLPVVVNEAFAKRFFPTGNAVGGRFGTALAGAVASGSYEIVGIVSDAKYRSLREPMTPTYYRLHSQSDSFQLLVRTEGRPEFLIEAIRQAIVELNPSVPVSEIHTLAEEVTSSVAAERLTAILASVYAVIALLIACVGVYGLFTYVVAQRQREIGIRIALGAVFKDLIKLIGSQGIIMVGLGVSLGLSIALVAGKWLTSLLYEVAPTDFVSIGVAIGSIVLLTALATMLPVLRAARTPPAAALRQEN